MLHRLSSSTMTIYMLVWQRAWWLLSQQSWILHQSESDTVSLGDAWGVAAIHCRWESKRIWSPGSVEVGKASSSRQTQEEARTAVNTFLFSNVFTLGMPFGCSVWGQVIIYSVLLRSALTYIPKSVSPRLLWLSSNWQSWWTHSC